MILDMTLVNDSGCDDACSAVDFLEERGARNRGAFVAWQRLPCRTLIALLFLSKGMLLEQVLVPKVVKVFIILWWGLCCCTARA